MCQLARDRAFLLQGQTRMLKTKPKPPPTPGSQIRNSKLRGEWAELRFMTRVAEHGVMISKPWGDSARYDLMIEHHGRVLRIQVKSTMRIVRGCYRCHLPTAAPPTNLSSRAQSRARPERTPSANEGKSNGDLLSFPERRASLSEPLSQNQIDFLAAYIIPLDLWYILPAPVTARLHGHISLSPHRKGHKYEPYLEAWHLLL